MSERYSQYLEQDFILEAFQHIGSLKDCSPDHGPRFLDIGAWHPTDKSNTRALFELGWSGVMIEPSPGPMLNMLKEYGNEPRITLIQACVSCVPGFVNMHVTDDAVSTSSDAVFEQWKASTEFYGSMMVPAITLEQIANQFGGFNFVNFDAEGCSVDLFLQMLALGWQPRCCCVETDDRLQELCSVATPHYNVVYANGTNAVLVRK